MKRKRLYGMEAGGDGNEMENENGGRIEKRDLYWR